MLYCVSLPECDGPNREILLPGYQVAVDTFQGTKISHPQGMFEDDFPFPQVRYASSPRR